MPVPRDWEPLTRINLEQTKFSLRQHIAEELLLNQSNLEVNFWQQDFVYGVVAEFRAHIWSHKLPPETKMAETQLTIPTWNSAWQLWKANHANSRWFGWIAKRWPPQKRGSETHTASVSFDLDKRTLFPTYNYPAGLGASYHHVVVSEPVWKWTDE